MSLGGSVFVDARRPSEYEVIAYIEGLECGRTKSQRFLHSDAATFGLVIASDAEIDGCGEPGDEVTLTVNGREVNKKYEWQPGPLPGSSTVLVVGPNFARYYGRVIMDAGYPPPMMVIPYIGDTVCGEELYSEATARHHVGYRLYQVVVDPDALVPGCGREGAVVRFVLKVEGHPDVDLGTEVWRPDGETPFERPAVDVTGQVPTRSSP
jgi:hypothetical protein